jgi:predicted DNA-binding ribbon-helix-helix protein
MKSAKISRSITFGGQKTSVSVEHAFWTGLKEIAHLRRVTVSKLVAEIDATRQQAICRRRSAFLCLNILKTKASAL